MHEQRLDHDVLGAQAEVGIEAEEVLEAVDVDHLDEAKRPDNEH